MQLEEIRTLDEAGWEERVFLSGMAFALTGMGGMALLLSIVGIYALLSLFLLFLLYRLIETGPGARPGEPELTPATLSGGAA